MIKNIINKIISPRFLIVYKNQNNRVKTYEISKPVLSNSFSNKGEQKGNAGFRAYCFGRKQYRSFRHDRIISITKC